MRTKILEDGGYVNIYDLIKYIEEEQIEYHGDNIMNTKDILKTLKSYIRGVI